MSGSIFGNDFRVSTFGESHGKAVGCVIDGCPAGLEFDLNFIKSEMARRKPGQSEFTTARKEGDEIEVLSGVFEGKTIGTPIMMVVFNKDQRSRDYSQIKNTYRPGHADYVFDAKYGFRDYRGGGRSSARETLARVAAGAVAKLFLKTIGVDIKAYVTQVHDIKTTQVDYNFIEKNPLRICDPTVLEQASKRILDAKANKDSVGGIIQVEAFGVPAGLGQPVFDKLTADLAKAIMSIPAVKGFEIGNGFDCVNLTGSQNNDVFTTDTEGNVVTTTNNSGGIQGGISNGMPICFRFVVKPVSSIEKKQQTVNQSGEAVELEVVGRHDPCVAPRAVVIAEAMTALVLINHYFASKNDKCLIF